MVDILSMVDLTLISAILAAIGVFVGVVFAILQLRDLVKTRQMDLLMRMHSDLNTKGKVQAWIAITQSEIKKPNEFMAKHLAEVIQIAIYYKELGILVGKKLLDVELVTDIIGIGAMEAWRKLGPIIRFRRAQFNNPRLYEWFEYLYNEMQKREQQLTTVQ